MKPYKSSIFDSKIIIWMVAVRSDKGFITGANNQYKMTKEIRTFNKTIVSPLARDDNENKYLMNN